MGIEFCEFHSRFGLKLTIATLHTALVGVEEHMRSAIAEPYPEGCGISHRQNLHRLHW